MLTAWATAAVLLLPPVPGAAAAAYDPRAIPLVDQDGVRFRLADLRGAPAFVTFVATRCSDACPLANAAFAQLGPRLRGPWRTVRRVTVTLDPQYDTPFVMSGAAREFDAHPERWTFASGAAADVHALMRSLGVVAKAGRSGIPEEHGSFVYVLDARVRLARTLLLSTRFPSDAEAALRALHWKPRETGR